MAGSRREFYMQNLLDAVNGDTATYPDLVAGTREEKYFQNMIDAASGNDLTYPDLVPVWANPEGWYEQLVLALQNGGGGCELLKSEEYTVSTTSTSEVDVASMSLTDIINDYTKNDIFLVHIYDKAGKRNGYFYGSVSFALLTPLANNTTSGAADIIKRMIRVNDTSSYATFTTAGIYPTQITLGNAASITIKAKYSATASGTISGVFKVDVYKLTMPPTLFP